MPKVPSHFSSNVNYDEAFQEGAAVSHTNKQLLSPFGDDDFDAQRAHESKGLRHRGFYSICTCLTIIILILTMMIVAPLVKTKSEQKTGEEYNPILVSFIQLALAGFVLIPFYFVLWFWYWRKARFSLDLNRVSKFILGGAVGVFPVIAVEYGLGDVWEYVGVKMPTIEKIWYSMLYSFVMAFIISAFTEECLKLILSMLVQRTSYDKPSNLLILTIAGSVGLALAQNLGNIYWISYQDGWGAAILAGGVNALFSVPLHASTGALIGSDVARRKFAISDPSVIRIMAYPIIFHGAYEFMSQMMLNWEELDLDAYWAYFLYIPQGLVVLFSFFLATKQIIAVHSLVDGSDYSTLSAAQ